MLNLFDILSFVVSFCYFGFGQRTLLIIVTIQTSVTSPVFFPFSFVFKGYNPYFIHCSAF